MVSWSLFHLHRVNELGEVRIHTAVGGVSLSHGNAVATEFFCWN